MHCLSLMYIYTPYLQFEHDKNGIVGEMWFGLDKN